MVIHESIRNGRRELRLAEAHKALGEELNTLSAWLGTAREEYDGLLEACLGDLPAWAEVDHDELRALFAVPRGDETVTVARAADALVLEIVGFARVWVGPEGGAARPGDLDRAAAVAWVAELDALAAQADAVAAAGREVARRAGEELPRRLEGLLAQVEAARDGGVAAVPLQMQSLRERLRAGKTGAALATRESQADVLEEQRRRTEALREAWSALEQLAVAGAEIGVEASAQLGEALQSLADAVIAGYPELREHAGKWVKEAAVPERRRHAPPPLPGGDGPSAEAADEAPQSVAPVDTTVTEEYDREIEFVAEVPAPAERPQLADESEPEEERVRVDTEPPRAVQHTPAPPRATASQETAPAAVLVIREPAFRVTTSWEIVPVGEVAMVLSVPAAYVAFLTMAALAYQVGVTGENPLREWSWALPVFGVFALWAVGMPTYLNWRVDWDGWKPRVMRLTERRQEGFLDVDDDGFTLGSARLGFATSAGAARRWQDGAARGWQLVVSEDLQRLALAADASSPRWVASELPCDEGEPEGCWRVSEGALLALVDHLDLVA